MPQIHPSAIVDRRAELADDVQIGPACVIDGPAVLGAGTRLIGHVYLHGLVRLGKANTVYPFCCLGMAPQDRKYDPQKDGAGVSIGDENILREGVSIHRATGERPTTAGHRNYLMVNTHLGHDVMMGDDCTVANGAGMAGHVSIGDRVVMGGYAAIHQFCRVGRLAMMSGSMGIVQDLPPFCTCYNSRCVQSLNLVGLRRAGYRAHIKPLQRAFDLLYRQGLPNNVAADRIVQELGDDPLCMELAAFVRSTQRGITPYREASPSDARG